MDRKQKMRKAAREYVQHSATSATTLSSTYVAGAEWAEKTTIEKVCEWLENNLTNYTFDDPKYGEYIKPWEVTECLKKAMEE